MKIENIELRESIQSWVAFAAICTALALFVLGVTGFEPVLVAMLFYVASILIRYERRLGDQEVTYDLITVQRGDNVWIFKIANYRVVVDEKRARNISRFLQVNPTSDSEE